MKKYDVFISYRRDGGEQSAKAIYDRLSDKGYRTFYDVETLRSGAFNTKLYSVIEECEDVVVILSPGALDRCHNEDDWVRLEIAHALRMKKNIIPILLRGFAFPADLPADIAEIQNLNGIQASVEFFDAFLQKLYDFMKSKPGIVNRVFRNSSWRRSLAAVGCCLLIAIGIWGAGIVLNERKTTYPATKEQKNDVNEMLYYIETNLTVLDNMFQIMDDATASCEDYAKDINSGSYGELKEELRHAEDALETQSGMLSELPSDLSEALKDTEINMADLTALYGYANTIKMQYSDTLKSLEAFMDPDSGLDGDSLARIAEIDNELVQLDVDSIFIGVCQLLLPVDESALKDFRTDYLPSLYVISNSVGQWTRDEVSIKSQNDRISTQQQKLLNEYSQIVGNENIGLISDKKALAALLAAGGMSKEDADDYIEDILSKNQDAENSKQELADLEEELESLKERIREKFAPVESDDPYLVWSKALRFLTAGMYDDAVEAFQFHLMQLKDTDENVRIYVPAAINFVNQMTQTGIDYGIIVVGYEPNKKPHEYYMIGDIIVALNSTPCRNFEEFQDLRSKVPGGDSYTATVLRGDENGQLQITDITIPDGQPKVAFLDLKESDQ